MRIEDFTNQMSAVRDEQYKYQKDLLMKLDSISDYINDLDIALNRIIDVLYLQANALTNISTALGYKDECDV